MIGIVVSRADDASVNIGRRLRGLADWTARTDGARPPDAGGGTYHTRPGFELRTFEELHLELDRPAAAFSDPDLLVFASKHAGDTGPLLTAHFTGNFGPAAHGGEANELARACPNAHAAVLDALATNAPPEFEVGMECTHHGPSAVGAPSMFVEIGSTAPEWEDPAAGRAVAESVLELAGTAPDRDRTVVGFGGGHYAPRFERIVRETDWAVGHVAADWCLDAMPDDALIEDAFRQSEATRAVFAAEDPALEERVRDRGYELVSETWLRQTTGVDLGLVDRLEAALAPVGDGLRLGAPARHTPADRPFEVVRPDPDLLADLASVDAAATRELVERRALAFETADGGSRVAGRIAVPEGSSYRELGAELCPILAEKYESVSRESGTITVVERCFDPDRATELGVPEGPAFGRLADGQSVEVDGRRVEPEAVHEVRERSYELRR